MNVKNEVKKATEYLLGAGDVLNDIPPLVIQEAWLLKINMKWQLNHRNLDHFISQSSSIRILRVLGDREVFGYRDLGVIHKVLEMNKGKAGLLLEE